MESNPNLLSVIIPVYNGSQVICATLDSVARQENVECEIIVVDDCSSDNTLAVLEGWSSRHPGQTVKVIAKPCRELTLKARISGIETASGPDIIFLDADDELLHTQSIGKILSAKRAGGYDIAHFRSQFSGEKMSGEANWNAPLSANPISGSKIFAMYAEKNFPPVLAWGKIYSTSLLKKIVPLAKELTIQRLEDVFLVSLAMLFAKSYCPFNEFGYLYHVSYNWPMEKYSARVQDLLRMRTFFQSIMRQENVEKQIYDDFLNFLERRIIFNINGFCEELANTLQHDIKFNDLYDRIFTVSQEGQSSSSFLTAMLHACNLTFSRLSNLSERLSDGSYICALDKDPRD